MVADRGMWSLQLRLHGMSAEDLAKIERELRDLRPFWPRVQMLASRDMLRNIQSPLAGITEAWARRKGHNAVFAWTGKLMGRVFRPQIKRARQRIVVSVGREKYPYVLHFGEKKRPSRKVPARPWFFWRNETKELVQIEARQWLDEIIAKHGLE